MLNILRLKKKKLVVSLFSLKDILLVTECRPPIPPIPILT